MTRPSVPRQRPHRPFRVVPPILRRIGDRRFSGYVILDEYDGTPGYLLWLTFRDTELWVSSTRSSSLFVPDPEGAEVRRSWAAELVPPFRAISPALVGLTDCLLQRSAEPEPISERCGEIAGWSEAQSRLGTAVEYAQVASIALPEDAMAAVRTARILRLRAEYERALTWFDHSIATARRTANWEAYAQAHSGLGCLYLQRGNLGRARKVLRRSLRTAVRHHLPERKAAAYHNLFAVEAISGNWTLAEKYASLALVHYPEGARGVPRMARDLAFRWIQRGYFERALPLASEVLQHFSMPADRALVWSDVARAAAGCGEAETFEEAWARAYAMTREYTVDPFEADILLNLAHAAASRGDVVRGRLVATRAIELARERREGSVQLEAEAVLDSLTVGQHIAPEPPPTPHTSEIADTFIDALKSARAAVQATAALVPRPG